MTSIGLSDGNVGIGTTNPMVKLDVNGTIFGSQTLIGTLYNRFNNIAYTVSTSWSSILSISYTPKSSNSQIIINYSGVVRVFSGSGNAYTQINIYVNSSLTNVSGNPQYVSHNQAIDLLVPFSITASYNNTSTTSKTIQLYAIITGSPTPIGDIRSPVVYIQEINN